MLVCVGVWKFWKIFWWGMKSWREIWMGHEFFGEKIIFPSAPVSGINNDQSLSFQIYHLVHAHYYVRYTHIIRVITKWERRQDKDKRLNWFTIFWRQILVPVSEYWLNDCVICVFVLSLFSFHNLSIHWRRTVYSFEIPGGLLNFICKITHSGHDFYSVFIIHANFFQMHFKFLIASLKLVPEHNMIK